MTSDKALTPLTFDEYLTDKKIDPVRFATAEPITYAEWASLFNHLSAASFTAQKKFLLNPTRRKYLIR